MSQPVYPTFGQVSDLQQTWLGLNSSTDTALLTNLLNMAEQELQMAVGMQMSGTYAVTEYYVVPRSKRVALRKLPVNSLTSVGVVTGSEYPSSPIPPIPINVSATPQEGYAYVIDNLLYLPAYQVWEGMKIQVVYNAGYATVPQDFYQACIELAGERYRVKDRIGHKSKSLAGEVVSYETARYNDFIKLVIQRYTAKVYS